MDFTGSCIGTPCTKNGAQSSTCEPQHQERYMGTHAGQARYNPHVPPKKTYYEKTHKHAAGLYREMYKIKRSIMRESNTPPSQEMCSTVHVQWRGPCPTSSLRYGLSYYPSIDLQLMPSTIQKENVQSPTMPTRYSYRRLANQPTQLLRTA